jgi:hypothetical protein
VDIAFHTLSSHVSERPRVSSQTSLTHLVTLKSEMTPFIPDTQGRHCNSLRPLDTHSLHSVKCHPLEQMDDVKLSMCHGSDRTYPHRHSGSPPTLFRFPGCLPYIAPKTSQGVLTTTIGRYFSSFPPNDKKKKIKQMLTKLKYR